MYSLRHQDIQLEMQGKPRKLHSGWLAALVRPYSSSVTSKGSLLGACNKRTTATRTLRSMTGSPGMLVLQQYILLATDSVVK